jgi:predicted dehydrogenase
MHSKPLRLGVVGYGTAGRRHVGAAERSELVELVGVADRDSGVLARYQGDAPRFPDLDALLAVRPDAVVIALPHALLVEAALHAIANGRHILLEKPVATDLDGARAIAAAATGAGIELMVNFNHRYRDEYARARELITTGDLGSPTLLSVQMLSGAGPLPPWVWTHSVAGGGMMLYNGVHTLDHLAWLADSRIVEVGAAVSTHHYPNRDDLEDTAIAHLRFASGALGSVVQLKTDSSATQGRWDTAVYGTRGSVRIRSGVGLSWSTHDGEGRIDTGEGDRYLATLEAFASALLAGRPAPVPIGAGFDALSTALGMYRSAREGRTVAVEALEGEGEHTA